jgi:dTDP-4-amino-4,6-dideoxygalactose transaminase
MTPAGIKKSLSKAPKVGTFGDIGVFAFYHNKLITTGEGGALVTNSTRLATRLRSLRNQGRQSDNWFQHGEPGFSYRLSDINCALGIEQLRRIETILQRRETLVKSYRKLSATLSISQRLLCLPLFNAMTEEQINFVCNSLDEILCERLATRVLHTEVS